MSLDLFHFICVLDVHHFHYVGLLECECAVECERLRKSCVICEGVYMDVLSPLLLPFPSHHHYFIALNKKN